MCVVACCDKAKDIPLGGRLCYQYGKIVLYIYYHTPNAFHTTTDVSIIVDALNGQSNEAMKEYSFVEVQQQQCNHDG